MKTILKILSFLAVISAIPVFAQPACSISGSYDMGAVVARPTFSCSQGTATNPQFEISGPGNSTYISVENWNNNTNQSFYNAGNNRSVRMVSITCSGTVQNTTVACGSINIIDPNAVIITPGEAAINLSREAQEIRGIGGMNYPDWTGGDLTAAQRETAFGNGNNQLGFTILRIHVDANPNNWQKEVATAKKAIELGAIVFASPWVAPASMNETFYRDAGNPNATRIKKSSYAAYAKHLDDFVKFMKQNGVDLYAISVQNEPDYAHDWTWWTPDEIVDFLINHAPSIGCRIMAPESFQYRKNMSDPILNNPAALANTDIFGVHMYGTANNQYAYPLFKEKGAGKELWMTEVYYPNSDTDADVWPQALDVADHVHRNLVDAEFQAYVWWYIRRSYGPIKENGNISKRGYMMAHFSKFVRPGYRRVDATKNPATDVFVSAYKGDNKVVIVAVNKQTSNINQKFVIGGGTSIVKMENWQTSQNENLAKKADITVTGGSFTVNLPARSVTTFVGDLPTLSSSSSSVTVSSSSVVPGSSSSGTVSSSSGGTIVEQCGEYDASFCGRSVRYADILSDSDAMPTEGQCMFIADFSKIQPNLNSTVSINGVENTCGDEWGEEEGKCMFNTKPAPKNGGYYVYVKSGGINAFVPEGQDDPNGWQGITAAIKVPCESASIVRNPLPAFNADTSRYYSLKGEPLGSNKPDKAGVYIMKQGSSIRKIMVR